MAKQKIMFILVILLVTGSLRAQPLSPIQCDRPDQTESPSVTPPGYIQAELGFLLEKTDDLIHSSSHPSVLWKYGVNERFELRLITEWGTEKENSTSETGLFPVSAGLKINLTGEKGILPTTSFIGHIATARLGSKPFHTSWFAPSFRFTMQHTLTENISLGYNIGAEWDGFSAEPSWIYTLATGFGLSERIGCYTELYGFYPVDGRADLRFDGGFTFLLNHHLLADLSAGTGLTGNAPAGFIAAGISWRFPVSGKTNFTKK